MSMRRLSLTLLIALAVVPTAAFAARSATGDGVFELQNATGSLAISGKGVLWGQMDRGLIKVTDSNLADGTVQVVGAEATRPVGENATVYRGAGLHFKLAGGGHYKLWFKGTRLDLTTVGVGNALLTGDENVDKTGSYSLDGSKWAPVPIVPLSVPFGTQPTPAPPATGP
jgi:hypothetical protein